jgi:hypothetical protein
VEAMSRPRWETVGTGGWRSLGRTYQPGSIRLWQVPCTVGTDLTMLLVHTPWPCLQHFQPGSTRMLPMRSAKPRHALGRGLPGASPALCRPRLVVVIISCPFLIVPLTGLARYVSLSVATQNPQAVYSIMQFVRVSFCVYRSRPCMILHSRVATHSPSKHGRGRWRGAVAYGMGYVCMDGLSRERI